MSKAKVAKKPALPLTRGHATMTESAYLAWIRSALRSKSLRWLPRTKALEAARRPYVGPNKLQKWEYCCAICKQWFKAKEVVVDHFPKAAGSILCVADIGQFAENLFCEVDNLRVLCSPDHDAWTLSEKQGISFEQALFEKKVNEIMKLPKQKLLDYLKQHAYTGSSVSNNQKRRLAVSTILKEQQHDT